MKSRITISLTEDGEFQILVNEAGRDELVRHLQSLDRDREHFHFAPAGQNMDCDVSEIPYQITDKVLPWGKVLFRPDDWDREFFPHVLAEKD